MGRSKLWRTLAVAAALAMIAAACGDGAEDPAEEPAAAEDPAEAPAEDDDAEAPAEADEAPDPSEVEGDDVTLTLGHPFPEGHPIAVNAIIPWAEEVEEATNGTVTIEIVPGGALSPSDAVYENTAAGAQDLGWALHGYTAGRFPLTDVVELPFTFESAEQATEVLWTLYDEFPELQEEYADTEVVALWTHDIGDLWVAGDPVETMEDVQGLTLRAPGPLQNELIEGLGGSAVGLPAADLFDSLERGVIDGLMIAKSGLNSFNLFEVLDHGVQCDCYVAAQFLVANPASWDQLSDSQREVVEALGREMSMTAAEVYDGIYDDVNDMLADEGIEMVVLEGEERENWEQAGQDVVDAWLADAGDAGQAMYERVQELTGN